jgi:hypothetical protein
MATGEVIKTHAETKPVGSVLALVRKIVSRFCFGALASTLDFGTQVVVENGLVKMKQSLNHASVLPAPLLVCSSESYRSQLLVVHPIDHDEGRISETRRKYGQKKM